MEFFILLFEVELDMPPLNWRKPLELCRPKKRRIILLDDDSMMLLEIEKNKELIEFYRLIQDKMIPN